MQLKKIKKNEETSGEETRRAIYGRIFIYVSLGFECIKKRPSFNYASINSVEMQICFRHQYMKRDDMKRERDDVMMLDLMQCRSCCCRLMQLQKKLKR